MLKPSHSTNAPWPLRNISWGHSILGVLTLSNLAVLYKSLGRYAEAEALYQQALPLFEQALEPTHPHVETCLRNYARLLRDTQRQAEARALEGCARQVRRARRVNK